MDLIYATSRVEDGNMSLKWGEEVTVNSNRKKFLAKLGMKVEDCVLMSLVHGVDVVKVGKKDLGKTIEADALITSEPGVGLFMMTADCFPVIVYDPGKMAGLAHLGYRGVWERLVQKVVKKFSGDVR